MRTTATTVTTTTTWAATTATSTWATCTPLSMTVTSSSSSGAASTWPQASSCASRRATRWRCSPDSPSRTSPAAATRRRRFGRRCSLCRSVLEPSSPPTLSPWPPCISWMMKGPNSSCTSMSITPFGAPSESTSAPASASLSACTTTSSRRSAPPTGSTQTSRRQTGPSAPCGRRTLSSASRSSHPCSTSWWAAPSRRREPCSCTIRA
mmetsp:Transcript_40734/g.127467  ORF Transcript_40734/g.127467 Transcript_40734/m.127467 type:complete len:208 (+) Transcript_40734:524-1147(+)